MKPEKQSQQAATGGERMSKLVYLTFIEFCDTL
jgi:hypothetical protein